MPEHTPTTQSTSTGSGSNTTDNKPYSAPQITHELELETHAGSPLGIPDPLDPAGIDPAE